MSTVGGSARVSATNGSGTGDELAFVAARLAAATRAEDVFGDLGGDLGAAQAGVTRARRDEQLARLRHRYRQLALAVHPDRHANDPAASAAFVALQRLYATALELVEQGWYGQTDRSGHAGGVGGRPAGRPDSVVLATRRRQYEVGARLAEGDLADLFTCLVTQNGQTRAGLLKIARDNQDNDLLMGEALALRRLLADLDGRPIPVYIPRLLESFTYQDGTGIERQVNAFPLAATERAPLPADEFFSLAEVRAAYRDGVDARQMAWMWRRLLIALGHAHDRGVVHGAVLPSHILVHPGEHGLLLVDWCYSAVEPSLTGTHIPAVVGAYERWYPLSVLAKHVATPAVDLEMALRTMVYLLGGDPLRAALPRSVPAQIQAYFQGALATVHQPMHRSTRRATAWELYQRFTSLMADLWGMRRFIPFSMPARRPSGAPGPVR